MERVERAKRAFGELLEVLPTLTDEEVGDLYGEEELWGLVASIFDISRLRQEAQKGTNLADLFLANRNRAKAIALVRHFATKLGAAGVTMKVLQLAPLDAAVLRSRPFVHHRSQQIAVVGFLLLFLHHPALEILVASAQ